VTAIPDRFKQSLDRYIQQGVIPGGFLHAVLANDLTMAVMRADEDSLPMLPDIVRYLYWEAPGNCWGSPSKVEQWRGLTPRRAIIMEDGGLPA